MLILASVERFSVPLYAAFFSWHIGEARFCKEIKLFFILSYLSWRFSRMNGWLYHNCSWTVVILTLSRSLLEYASSFTFRFALNFLYGLTSTTFLCLIFERNFDCLCIAFVICLKNPNLPSSFNFSILSRTVIPDWQPFPAGITGQIVPYSWRSCNRGLMTFHSKDVCLVAFNKKQKNIDTGVNWTTQGVRIQAQIPKKDHQ